MLHLDRNSYYGGDSASLNLTHLWEKFRAGEKPPAEYGMNRDWNIDLIPKFIMACGKLVKILLHTKVQGITHRSLIFSINPNSIFRRVCTKRPFPKLEDTGKVLILYRHQLDLYLSYGARSCADRELRVLALDRHKNGLRTISIMSSWWRQKLKASFLKKSFGILKPYILPKMVDPGRQLS